MNLSYVEIDGFWLYIREDTFQPGMGYTWDADIALEVFRSDCYGLNKINEPIQNIIDIGANIGTFSLFAKKKWPHCNIICAEPFNETFHVLSQNLKNYSNVTLLNKAIVGNSCKQVRFNPPSYKQNSHNKNGGDAHVSDNGPIVCRRGLLFIRSPLQYHLPRPTQDRLRRRGSRYPP